MSSDWTDVINSFAIFASVNCYEMLYNNQSNVRALIGQSAVVYCAGKPTEKSRISWIIIQKQ